MCACILWCHDVCEVNHLCACMWCVVCVCVMRCVCGLGVLCACVSCDVCVASVCHVMCVWPRCVCACVSCDVCVASVCVCVASVCLASRVCACKCVLWRVMCFVLCDVFCGMWHVVCGVCMRARSQQAACGSGGNRGSRGVIYINRVIEVITYTLTHLHTSTLTISHTCTVISVSQTHEITPQRPSPPSLRVHSSRSPTHSHIILPHLPPIFVSVSIGVHLCTCICIH
jgi:hypothetical protein